MALRKAIDYAEIRRKPRGKIPVIMGIQKAKSRLIIESALHRKTEQLLWLSYEEISGLFRCYGIRQVAKTFAKTVAETKIAAGLLGFSLAVKLESPTITHKTDVGGVILNVHSESGVGQAYNPIKKNPEKLGRQQEMTGVTIQEMVAGGIETIVGVTQDPSFGPLMMFGSGGIYAELTQDIALKLHPITDTDAAEMISSLKMARIFEGYRGSPPSDIKALQDLLLRVSAIVEDIPEITELDLNPVAVMAQGDGYRVIDARIMVG
ncbi:acetate--CoA ligase family protein [Chloroflexota bacterium]